MADMLIVCESNAKRRQALKERILALVPEALILSDNRELLQFDFSAYDWALIVTDPCGYGT
jgi:hypothetical protein